MDASNSTNAIEAHSMAWRHQCLALVCVWVVFLTWSGVRWPVPAVNEPHYLTKARHAADPDWCKGDLFLESVNAHFVFVSIAGPITKVLSFEQTAWIGRAFGLFVLAFGWLRMVRVFLSPIGAALSVIVFLALGSIGNFSGEWIVGGFESKVVAWACLFAAVGFRLEGRLIPTAVCTGLAIAVHPVVGGWHLLSLGFCELVTFIATRKPRFPLSQYSLALVTAVVFALPGLIPAVQMLATKVDQEVKAAGNIIQVFTRLKHHLDPMHFPPSAWWMYAVLLVLTLVASRLVRTADHGWNRGHWFAAYVAATLLIACGGLLAGLGPRPAEQMANLEIRAFLLKFYPFRMFRHHVACRNKSDCGESRWRKSVGNPSHSQISVCGRRDRVRCGADSMATGSASSWEDSWNSERLARCLRVVEPALAARRFGTDAHSVIRVQVVCAACGVRELEGLPAGCSRDCRMAAAA